METVHLGSRSDPLKNVPRTGIDSRIGPDKGDSVNKSEHAVCTGTGTHDSERKVVSEVLGRRRVHAKHSGPQMLPYGPPGHAKPFYKMVLIQHDDMPLSIHNGRTQYPIGNSFVQSGVSEDEGAMFVFVKVRDAILNEDKDSVLSPDKRRLPLAVAKVLAWNSDRLEVPAQHGFKKAYAFIQVIEVLPVPPIFEANLARPINASISPVKEFKPLAVASSDYRKDGASSHITSANSHRQSSGWWNRSVTTTLQSASGSDEPINASRRSLNESVASTSKLLSDVLNMEEKFKHMRGI